MTYHYIEIIPKSEEEMITDINNLLDTEIVSLYYENRKIITIEDGDLTEDQLRALENYMNAWGYTRYIPEE